MTRPRKPTASAGSQLRDALAKSRAAEQTSEQQRQSAEETALQTSLSNWFNTVAADVPAKVAGITKAAQAGRPVAGDFSYSATDMGVSLKGASTVDLASLDGFKKLDAACKELDIECTVTEGRHGYGRKSTAGQPYLHISVDAEKPYQPLVAEKVKPRGYRR